MPLGARLGDVLRLDDAQAVLIGGYAGTWVEAGRAANLRLDRGSLAPAGAALGAGVLAALPADRCGLRETARVVGYLAGQSAGQCGPCLNGLPRIAAALDLLARPARPAVRTARRRPALVGAAARSGRLLPPRRHRAPGRQRAAGVRRPSSRCTGRAAAARAPAGPSSPCPGATDDPAGRGPDPLHRARAVRGTAARGHQPRRVGLSADRLRRAPAGPRADGEEGGGRLPDAGTAAAGR